jgi:RHS repeat-associated protein
MVYLFQGGRFDWTTLNYIFQNRVYRPSIQVWVSQDPLDFAAGPNWYEFAGNNPTNMTDPSGLVQLRWKLAKGVKELACAPGQQNTLIATATDEKGNVFELWCNGEFYGILRQKGQQPLYFGACIVFRGQNIWYVEYDKKAFKKFRWFNIKPKPGEDARKGIAGAHGRLNIPAGSTAAMDEASELEALTAARQHLAVRNENKLEWFDDSKNTKLGIK